MDDLIQKKKMELSLVKKLGAQTTEMVDLLNKLVNELSDVHSEVEKVDMIMNNWGIIVRCISASSISLLHYQEDSYEQGIWENEEKDSETSSGEQKSIDTSNNNNKNNNNNNGKPIPLPETMIRLELNEQE